MCIVLVTPLTFEAALVQCPPELAFHKAVEYLSKKALLLNFVLQIQIQKMEKLLIAIMLYDLMNLYKLWNIAMQYGNKSANISPLTEEQGKFKY